MDTVKAGQPLQNVVALCYRANVPLLLIGRHGVGKSEALRQAADALKIRSIVLDLSLLEPSDLCGLPKAEGRTTINLPPAKFPRKGSGLLVLEELNRAEPSVRAPALQLLSARKLNDYELPPGWLPVATSNPPDEEYEVDPLDPALVSRFTQVKVVADRTQWLVWARLNGVHPDVIAYVERDAHIFDEPESNPRSWTHVSHLLCAADQCADFRSSLRAAVIGKVGDARGSAFLATLKTTDQPLTARDVLLGYDTYRAKVVHWISSGRIDAVAATLNSIYLHIQPKAEYQAVREDPQQWKRLAQFFGELPRDFREQAKKNFADREYDFPLVGRTRKQRR